MIFDTHVHTTMSSDSKMTPEIAIETANKKGIGLIFTEHLDIGYPANDYDFRVDSEKYLKTYENLRNDNLLLGIEIGLTHEDIVENKKVAQSHDFDFIIGSIHIVNGKDIYDGFFDADKSEVQLYREYLQFVLDMSEQNDFFHSLGHIDYISRYSPFDVKNIEYAKYQDLYDKILKTLIEKNIVIEINTRRFSDTSAVQCIFEISKKYYELGGKYVTLGSDAHHTTDILRNFNAAINMINEIGLKPVRFKNRKLEVCE